MIKAIAIDLDDTLVNTTGLLAPQAAYEAFSYLIENGLQLNLQQCESERIELIKNLSHRDVFELLAQKYGSEQTQFAVSKAIDLFYDPNLPSRLPLMEGAEKNLQYLQPKYALYLVTAGSAKAQLKKVEALGIAGYFRRVMVVDSLTKKKKKDSFEEILREQSLKASELLCIGNSLLSEIADALAIGAWACHFEFGEERGHISQLPRKPHFHVQHHAELIATCQL